MKTNSWENVRSFPSPSPQEIINLSNNIGQIDDAEWDKQFHKLFLHQANDGKWDFKYYGENKDTLLGITIRIMNLASDKISAADLYAMFIFLQGTMQHDRKLLTYKNASNQTIFDILASCDNIEPVIKASMLFCFITQLHLSPIRENKSTYYSKHLDSFIYSDTDAKKYKTYTSKNHTILHRAMLYLAKNMQNGSCDTIVLRALLIYSPSLALVANNDGNTPLEEFYKFPYVMNLSGSQLHLVHFEFINAGLMPSQIFKNSELNNLIRVGFNDNGINNNSILKRYAILLAACAYQNAKKISKLGKTYKIATNIGHIRSLLPKTALSGCTNYLINEMRFLFFNVLHIPNENIILRTENGPFSCWGKKGGIDVINTTIYFTQYYFTEQKAIELIHTLIELGHDINTVDSNDNVALVKAIKSDVSVDFITKLIEYGANPNFATSGEHNQQSPIHLAAAIGRLDIIPVLLKHGANINAKDTQDRTPLHYAVQNMQLKALTILLENGADVNEQDLQGNTPLHYVVYFISSIIGNKIMKKLLDCGADKYITNSEGYTPKSYACENGFYNYSSILKDPNDIEMEEYSIESDSSDSELSSDEDLEFEGQGNFVIPTTNNIARNNVPMANAFVLVPDTAMQTRGAVSLGADSSMVMNRSLHFALENAQSGNYIF